MCSHRPQHQGYSGGRRIVAKICKRQHRDGGDEAWEVRKNILSNEITNLKSEQKCCANVS